MRCPRTGCLFGFLPEALWVFVQGSGFWSMIWPRGVCGQQMDMAVDNSFRSKYCDNHSDTRFTSSRVSSTMMMIIAFDLLWLSLPYCRRHLGDFV